LQYGFAAMPRHATCARLPPATIAALIESFPCWAGAQLLTGATLNIFSINGSITRMGLMTNSAILLIDFTNRARREPRRIATTSQPAPGD
jgi:multidrug efflux pump subunit AcrB